MLLTTLGQRLRARRKELQYSQAKVAKRSGVSLRFLADVEMGRSNISVLRLAEICAALQIPLAELMRGLGSNGAQMLSLVGMRGAGKSTIGRALAADLQVTFLELDQLIAEEAQMPLSEIFSMGGMALYREYESTTLQKLFESGKPIILATGGSLVLDVQNWSRLRGYSRTVWLRCAPEVYLERVREQGDWRPMQGYSDALDEVKSILQERGKLYAQADLVVDTDEKSIGTAVGQLKEFFQSNL
jgi:XRE family aerobic/anaerobic benzoate catabolism transcriptional regulator